MKTSTALNRYGLCESGNARYLVASRTNTVPTMHYLIENATTCHPRIATEAWTPCGIIWANADIDGYGYYDDDERAMLTPGGVDGDPEFLNGRICKRCELATARMER